MLASELVVVLSAGGPASSATVFGIGDVALEAFNVLFAVIVEGV